MPDLLPFVIAGLCTGALYALSGVGLVMLYRASGVINLAQGAIGALSAIVVWQLTQFGWPLAVGCVAGIAVATLVSLLYGRLIAPLLAHADPILRTVATLGLALFLLGFINFIWGESGRALRLPTDAFSISVFGVRVTYTRILVLVLAAAITIGIFLLLGRTRLGLAMRALASGRDVSALLGIPVLRVDAWACDSCCSERGYGQRRYDQRARQPRHDESLNRGRARTATG